MVCPVCSNPLSRMSTKSDYGAELFFNRCAYCGGLWLEGLTLYQIPKKESERIESLPKAVEWRKSSEPPLTCPVCYVKLTPFKDPNLPPELSIERCEECKGVWIDSGELTAYKNYQDKRRRHGRISQIKYELSREEYLAFLFVFFLLLVLPASVFLTRKGFDSIGRALEMREETRIEKVTTSQITRDSAIINWKTSRKATSQVAYGETQTYGFFSILDLYLTEDHRVSLTDLENNTLYHFKVISQDEDGKIVESGDYTFVTLPR